jgi:TatD DNase family protein
MGDRGGGRESKGGSLRKSSKNPGSVVAKAKKEKVDKTLLTGSSTQPTEPPGEEPYFDSGCALLSRLFERDRDRVLQRSQQEGVRCAVAWVEDVEKQGPLYDLCKTNTGTLFCAIGVHPSNIEKTNKKAHDIWLEKVEQLARRGECVAIHTGLNLSRVQGTHFPQETMFRSLYKLARKLSLPLVLHNASDSDSTLRSIEVLIEEGWTAADTNTPVLVHDAVTACGGDVAKMQAVLDFGLVPMVSAAGIADLVEESVQLKARECIRAIPIDKLLTCTDSPWHTPQNLPDTYLRTLRNEPSNISAVYQALAEIHSQGDDSSSVSVKSIAEAVMSRSLEIFGLLAGKKGPTTTEAASGVPKLAVPRKERVTDKKSKEDSKDTGTTTPGEGVHTSPSDNYPSHGIINKKQQADSDAESDDGVNSDNNADSAAVQGEEGENHGGESAFADNAAVAAVTDVLVEEVESLTVSTAFFSCRKCRTRLFRHSDCSSHGLDAVRQATTQGLCSSILFVACTDSMDMSQRTGLAAQQTANVECKQCFAKVGKLCYSDTACSCGAEVRVLDIPSR